MRTIVIKDIFCKFTKYLAHILLLMEYNYNKSNNMNTFFKSLTALTMVTFAASASGTSSNPLIEGSNLPFGTMPLSKLTPEQYEEGVLEGIRLQNQ